MKIQRLRFILLCLFLLCLISNTWTCETRYADAASKAHLAEIVLIAKFEQKLRFGSSDDSYNATFKVANKRSILKGGHLLTKVLNGRGPTLIQVGMIGTHDPENCVADMEKEIDYLLFLNRTQNSDYFRIFAVPVSGKNKREFKKAKRDVKKILCKSGKQCVKLPVINPKKMKNTDIKVGQRLNLSCKLKQKSFPYPMFSWLKDGEPISLANPKAQIKSNKRGSRLRIRKVKESDAGRYTCIAENVGGDTHQEAVITVLSEEGASKPQAGSRVLRDKKQKFGGRLSLRCKIKSETSPPTSFFWYKDDKPINDNIKQGLTIESTKDYSRLEIAKTLQGDGGKYTCVAKNANGEVMQHSNVKVTDVERTTLISTASKAPKKKINCTEEEQAFCLNGGLCERYVELDQIYCVCNEDYRGPRCSEFVPSGISKKIGEEKLSRDRTFVVVGIISGILLFIGICVLSYFLAKRRRDRFHARQRAHGNIEDNIPQVYRPLIGCDDIDGLNKKMNGVLIHKEVQTVETCFLNSDKANLYINPLEGYVNENGGDHSHRSRKSAISSDGDPRQKYSGHSDSDEENMGRVNRNSGRPDKPTHRDKPVNNSNRQSNSGLNLDGAPNGSMNDLSPKRLPIQRTNERPTCATPNVVDIPRCKSNQPLTFNLEESESDEEVPDGTPLTPLHISEGEENNYGDGFIFKKCKPVKGRTNSTSGDTKQENIAETKSKAPSSTKGAAPGPPRHDGNNRLKEHSSRSGIMHPNDNREHRGKPSNRYDIKSNSKQTPRLTMNDLKDNNKTKAQRPSERNDAFKGPERQDKMDARAGRRLAQVPAPEQMPGDIKMKIDDVIPLTSPGTVSTVTSTSENIDSDNSSSTEGCDSPNTAWLNAQEEDFSDHDPHHNHRSDVLKHLQAPSVPSQQANQSGTQEAPSNSNFNFLNAFPKNGSRNMGSGDKNRNQIKSEGDSVATKLKNKFTIAI